MLSRVAENLYWMARYLERTEDMARLINATTLLLLDLPPRARFGWDILLQVAGVSELYREHYGPPEETRIMRFLAGRPQADLFQRLRTLLADHRIRPTLRRFSRLLHQGKHRRPHRRGRG